MAFRISVLASAAAIAFTAPPLHAQAAGPARIDLLPLLEVTPLSPSVNTLPPFGGYVRFWIERVGDPATGPSRDYGVEVRPPLNRFLMGRNLSRVLSARLTVHRSTPVTQTVTLASSSHLSNRRDGESWTTEVGERRNFTPYMRIDQATTASIEVSLTASSRIDADIAGNILSIIQAGARLAAPTGPLVTSLNSERMTQATSFFDNAISRLFSEALVERSQTELPAERWFARSDDGSARAFATISAIFPMGRHVWRGDQNRSLVEWRIHASEPVVSMFAPLALNETALATGETERCANATGAGGTQPLSGSDLQACRAFRDLQPTRVLAFPIGENVTLGQALRGDAAITAALQRFPGAANGGVAAREICLLVMERLDALGLNVYDTAAALWAFALTDGIGGQAAHKMWMGDCSAAQLAVRLGLPPVPNSANEPAAPQPEATPEVPSDPAAGAANPPPRG